MPSTPPSLAKPSPLPPARLEETLLLLFSRSPYCSQPTPFCRMSPGFQGPNRTPGASARGARFLSPTPPLRQLELERLSPAAFSRAAPATPAPGARRAPRRGPVYRAPGSQQSDASTSPRSTSSPQPGRPLPAPAAPSGLGPAPLVARTRRPRPTRPRPLGLPF